jgi:hypothetical protein
MATILSSAKAFEPFTLSAAGEYYLGDGEVGLASQMSVQLTDPSAMALTLAVQGTVDGTNYKDLLMLPVGSATPVTSATAVNIWRVDTSGLKRVRLSVSGFSAAGTATFAPVVG